jgi:hypothetical protein
MEQYEQINIKGMSGETLNINYQIDPKTKNKIILELNKFDGEKLILKVDGFLFGSLISILQRVLMKWDGVILITGDVGDGKSTLAQLITSIWEWFFNRQQKVEFIVFRSENFTDLIEQEDNSTHAILWDEAIQGGTGRDSITKQGQALKKAFVTKRYKRHLYLLLVDEIQEYNKKIISRCRLWVHCYTNGLKRGYYKLYDDKTQIKRMYRKIKQYNLELDEVIKTETPTWRGYQTDTTGLFYDEKEYQNKKASETNKEDEKDNAKSDKVMNQRDKLIKMLIGMKIKQKDIAKEIGLSSQSISYILQKQSH